jgi:hypothetical protein
VARLNRAPKAGSPLIVIATALSVPSCSKPSKVWPGKGEACRKVGATANLDSFCAHRPQRCAGRDEETDFEIDQETDEGKRCAALANSLTKKAPYKGPGADSEEKHEPVSDIDTVVVDSLKALDPERPIREAEVQPQPCYVAEVPGAVLAPFAHART